MNSELDRIFDKGLSEVTRAPKVPLSDEQIAAAARESRSGAGVWLRMHAKEILLCAVSLAIGVGGTLLVMHLLGSRNTVPAETAAAIATDTANRIIYYHTMYNRTIRRIDMNAIDFEAVAFQSHPLDTTESETIIDAPVNW